MVRSRREPIASFPSERRRGEERERVAIGVALLWQENPEVRRCLRAAETLELARRRLYDLVEERERKLLWSENGLHPLEKNLAQRAARAIKEITSPLNEARAGSSLLVPLWLLAQDPKTLTQTGITAGFVSEVRNLFLALNGRTEIYSAQQEVPAFWKLRGRRSAAVRTTVLDRMAGDVRAAMGRYPAGLDEAVVRRRERNRARILDYFGGAPEDWHDHVWHLKNVIRTTGPLRDLVELSADEERAVDRAVEAGLPFGLTPYYLSLFDARAGGERDHAIRAQVLPPLDYVRALVGAEGPRDQTVLDFMGEHDTSPVDLVTRRYPGIAILKPYNTCAQICVYCQRNWEIDDCLSREAVADRAQLDEALAWFDEHPDVGEVLFTGGDPCVMNDTWLRRILSALAAKPQIYRIRIGTRTPVVLPQRWTAALADLLAEFHDPGRREIAVVTHFEHPYEVTPEAMGAVQRIRRAGLSVYNQLVFTFENSRRFEAARLRRELRRIGVDPYYTFNTKGKAETHHYRVPIARVLQELREEARLLPGLDRTDEPVFNVPRLGKNYLRAGQDHRLVMIRPDGSRVYEFHPWEKGLTAVPPYLFTDVPIQSYLDRLAERGEDPGEYGTIWYYY